MSRVFALLFLGRSGLDSFADRLSCRITVCILLVIASLAVVRTLISEPIRCCVPTEFSASQAAFADQACWLSAKYRPSREYTYNIYYHAAFYRWIPLTLTIHAFFFYLPKLFWNFASSISGSINVLHITSSQIQRQQNSLETNAAAQNVHYMARCLGRQLVEFDTQWKLASYVKRFWLLLRANCTFIFYIVVKLFYAVNCLLQLIRISGYLGGNQSAMNRLTSGTYEDLNQTVHSFPRWIKCEVDMRIRLYMESYLLYCLLPLNFLYEIVFLFLYSWFLFVAIATVWSLTCFVISMVDVFYQERYCRLRLMALSKANETQSKEVSQFIRRFLTRDAWFIVQKVGVISGDQMATELVCGLWEDYIEYKQPVECVDSPSSSEIKLRSLPNSSI